MSTWRDCYLGDLLTFQRGYDLPKEKMSGHSYPVVGSNGIIGYHDEYTTEAPSITIGRSGNVGNPFIVYGRSWSHNTTLYVKEFKDVDPVFLYYFLKTLNLGSYAGGSAVPTLNRNHIHSLPVHVPAVMKEQRQIGEVLKSLDDKINNNDKINDNLLQQAMAIFNDRYDSAEEQCPFTSLIHVLGGGTPKTGNPEFWNGDIPFFTPKDVGCPYTFQTEKTITATGLEHCNSRLYPENTSFVTARGTVGKVSLAGKPMAMNQSCYALASDSIDSILVYFYTLRAVDSLKHKASGAVFDAIVTRDFETEVISVIPESESKAVLALIAPMLKAIHTNTEESIRLATLRDALLPRLMSGKIDVSNVSL